MQEVNLVADLLIAMREGIKSKKQVKPFYARYEKAESDNVSGLEERFDEIITCIGLSLLKSPSGQGTGSPTKTSAGDCR
jgi:pyruvate-formate lyase